MHKKGGKKLERKDATHLLSCRHSQNSRQHYDYYMDCIIIKEMPGQRLKILVFGERYWKGHDNKQRIRYVDKSRVTEKELKEKLEEKKGEIRKDLDLGKGSKKKDV